MSVINKMLKDIEKREDTTQLPIGPTVEVANIVDTQLWIKVGLLGTFLFACLILAYLFIPSKLSESSKVIGLSQAVQQVAPKTLAKPALEAEQSEPATLILSSSKVEKEPNHTVVLETSDVQTNLSSAEQIVKTKNVPTVPSKEKQTAAIAAHIQQLTPQPEARIQVTRLTTRERAEEWFTQGKESFKFGLVDDAIRDLDKSLTLMPMHIDARSLLAAAYYGRGQLAQADAILRHGLSLNPDVMRWRILLAKILVERQSYESVMSILSSSYDAHANIDYWILKGTAAQQLNENAIALSSFRKLTQLQPDQAKWWLALASSSDAAGEQSNARRFYMTALELGGLSPNSRSHAEKRLEYLGGRL